jgi:mitogen-activated protein kinase 1/3
MEEEKRDDEVITD